MLSGLLGASLLTISWLSKFQTFAQETSTSSSSSKLAVYWGQNSVGTADSQLNLASYCNDDTIDIVILSFLNEFYNKVDKDLPGLNFASACWTTFPNTGMLTCSKIADDIKTCQNNGKKVLLSLGGATGSFGFNSNEQAESYADTLWNLFGAGTAELRPFGDSIIDGFDLDIESGGSTGYASLVTKLRENFAKDTSKTYYISAAPQCPIPDAHLDDAIKNSHIDFLFVQFYNNYCGVNKFGTSSFNFADWNNLALTSSLNKNVKVYLGVPASQSSAGSGYVDPATLKNIVNSVKDYPSFGGVMLWDASSAYGNIDSGVNYAQAAKAALAGSGSVVSSSAIYASSSAYQSSIYELSSSSIVYYEPSSSAYQSSIYEPSSSSIVYYEPSSSVYQSSIYEPSSSSIVYYEPSSIAYYEPSSSVWSQSSTSDNIPSSSVWSQSSTSDNIYAASSTEDSKQIQLQSTVEPLSVGSPVGVSIYEQYHPEVSSTVSSFETLSSSSSNSNNIYVFSSSKLSPTFTITSTSSSAVVTTFTEVTSGEVSDSAYASSIKYVISDSAAINYQSESVKNKINYRVNNELSLSNYEIHAKSSQLSSSTDSLPNFSILSSSSSPLSSSSLFYSLSSSSSSSSSLSSYFPPSSITPPAALFTPQGKLVTVPVLQKSELTSNGSIVTVFFTVSTTVFIGSIPNVSSTPKVFKTALPYATATEGSTTLYGSVTQVLPSHTQSSSSAGTDSECHIHGESCKIEGTLVCNGDYFGVCINGRWNFRYCGDNLTCISSGNSLYCDYKSNGNTSSCNYPAEKIFAN